MPEEKAVAVRLTDRQQDVLETLRDIGRENAVRYRSKTPHLYQQDCEKLLKGDEACVFGLGGLHFSQTPLASLCRGIVNDLLGDTVKVPKELIDAD
ncbi:hypothetical protein [Pseudomonas sp. HLMP]|uniref:hypothetical protein n=1 Tax=Pseudomonas sp. HLMP TaxID=3153767 RepID=UPI0039679495